MPARRLFVAWLLLLSSGAFAPPPTGADGPGEDPVGGWPLTPVPAVVERFAPPAAPWGAGHRGVDLLGRVGQPVLAALPGTITFAAVLAGRGVVVVDHGAARTTYEPVLATVPVGATVAAGQQIGVLELRGSHCLPAACLHWGWRRGDSYLDPLRLVGLGPVRLMPLTGLPAGPDPSPPMPMSPRLPGQARGWACW